jgi:hypothetical protein
MKTSTTIIVVFFIQTIFLSAQTTHRYNETFDVNNNPGWAFTTTQANITVSNGNLQLSSPHEDVVHMILPTGATKDDFTFKIVPGSDASGINSGGFGRMGFKSLVALHIEDDSISVLYTGDIQSYSDPNFTWLKTHLLPEQINSIELRGTKSANNLIIEAFVNEFMFYNGTITNADAGLFSGQMVVYLVGDENDPLVWSVSEVDIHYNPTSSTQGVYSDEFTDANSPWFRFGDFDNLAQSLTINNGKLNFTYNGQSEPWLYVISPVGSVSDFTVEVEGGAGPNHNAPFEMSRFFDYRNYVTMFTEDDSIYVGYSLNSIEPNVIGSVPFPSGTISKIKFGVEGNIPNLTLKVWVNDNLLITRTLNNASEKLGSGHIALGYSRGNVMDAYLERAVINYTKYTPTQNEWKDHVTNNLLLSVFPDGLLAQNHLFNAGNGLKFMNYSDLLYTGGLIFGNQSVGASGMIGSFNYFDMTATQDLWSIPPGNFFDTRYRTSYHDINFTSRYGLEVMQESFSSVSNDIVFFKYLLKNVSGNSISDLYIGMFADFDLVNYPTNLGGYTPSKKLIYQYDAASQVHVGLIALSGLAGGKVTSGDGNRFDIYNYMKATDYTTPVATGDNRTYISTGPVSLNNNGETVVTFALVAGTSLTNLEANADEALSIYNSQLIGIKESASIELKNFQLYQNYPNPFNPTTTIKFAIPNVARDLSRNNDKSFVTLKVFDILGNEITTLINGTKSPGTYEVTWNAANVPSGVYFYKVNFDNSTIVKKMILMK